MLMAAVGAIQLAGKVGGLLSGLIGGNQKDQERIDSARTKAAAAIAGDVEAAKYVYGAQTGSATQVGKDAYKAAWAAIVAQNPAVAAAAEPGAVTQASAAIGPNTAQRSALQSEIDKLRDSLRTDIANSVQRIGAGATNALAQGIAPDGTTTDGAVTIPTSKRTLGLIAAGVAAALVIVWLLARRK